jgi:hypothetical protein
MESNASDLFKTIDEVKLQKKDALVKVKLLNKTIADFEYRLLLIYLRNGFPNASSTEIEKIKKIEKKVIKANKKRESKQASTCSTSADSGVRIQ